MRSSSGPQLTIISIGEYVVLWMIKNYEEENLEMENTYKPKDNSIMEGMWTEELSAHVRRKRIKI